MRLINERYANKEFLLPIFFISAIQQVKEKLYWHGRDKDKDGTNMNIYQIIESKPILFTLLTNYYWRIKFNKALIKFGLWLGIAQKIAMYSNPQRSNSWFLTSYIFSTS